MLLSGKLRVGNWLMLLWVVTIISCDTASQKSASQKPHFDIPGFIRSETSRFKESGIALQKIVYTQGKTESHTIRQPDWGDAFQYFLLTDLNAPVTAKWLSVDTLISGSQKQLIYVSTDSTSKLRRACVIFSGNVVDSISIELYKSGLYGAESQLLKYKRGVAYDMRFLLNPTVGEATDLEVTGKMIPKN